MAKALAVDRRTRFRAARRNDGRILLWVCPDVARAVGRSSGYTFADTRLGVTL